MVKIPKSEYKSEKILEDLLGKEKNVVDLIVEMKDMVNLAIALGFSALLMQDQKLVEKIHELEEEIDIRQYEVEAECMLATKTPKDALELTSVLRLSSAMEDISNAIKELIDSLSRGIPIHPTILKGLKDSIEVADFVEIKKRSKVIGKTIEELTEGHVSVIGLKRDDKWRYLPKKDDAISAGDVLIISGRKNDVSSIIKKS
ncbi:MAG: hypothetical protein JW789_01635 [Candidatus Aenigmarchaeota archaeon]|nr:hypothetical protein [Candidatus Aenigmarchaeota archaeon]